MDDTSTGLVIPSSIEAKAALAGTLSDSGAVRGNGAAPAETVREWTVAEARKAIGLTERPSSWIGNVGDPLVFAENERRKILAVIGDLAGIQDLIWNRTLIAVWRAPGEKKLGGGMVLHRTDAARDEAHWQGNVGLVVKLGPTAFVRDTDEAGNPVFYPQAPEVGDWVFFTRGYGTRIKINDIPCIIVDKETEAIRMVLAWPHALDLT